MKKLPFFLPFAACPGRCIYCNQHKITGALDIPSPDFVAALLKQQTETKEVCFFGGSFLRFPFETVKAYLDAVTENAPAGSSIRFSTYPVDLDNEHLCELLKSYNISKIELGIQSLDSNVLRVCKRDIDAEKVLQSVAHAASCKFPLGMQLMIGLPGQTATSSKADLDKLANIKGRDVWDLRIYPCLVIEGTELAKMYKSGAYTPLTVDKAAEIAGELIYRAEILGYNVIRVGLQECESLTQAVVAGPHHPALGELAMSHALVQKLLTQSKQGPWFVLAKDRSKFSGHGNFGYRLLAKATGLPLGEIKTLVSFN